MIRVLVVDDSAFMRKLLTDLFERESDFQVADTARNGQDAVEKVKLLKPDLVTMDVEMPVLDGLQALEVIMRDCPVPVVMISSLTKKGADTTVKALALGAVDFVAKAGGAISSITAIQEDILRVCRSAAKANLKPLISRGVSSEVVTSAVPIIRPAMSRPASMGLGTGGAQRIVAIGTSTGGPKALQEVLTRLPGNLPCGVVVVQHMPPGFTKSLAERLNTLSALTVKEAEHQDEIKPGHAYIAPGDYHMAVGRDSSGRAIIKLSQEPPVGGHRPAVDPMFASVAITFGRNTVAVLMTGMGQDGARGMEAIKAQQGWNIAEDQSTAVVYGMPKAAVDRGVVDRVVPLTSIPAEIVRAVTQ